MFAPLVSKAVAGLLAASTVAMAGAGPISGSVQIRIGDHDHRRPRPVIVHPRPIIVQPAPVVYVPVEVAPRALQLEAFQTGSTILIIARGENATGGFITRLEAADRGGRIFLRNLAPAPYTPVAQACAPFALTGTVAAYAPLSEVRVVVAGVEQCVPVTQTGAIPRC